MIRPTTRLWVSLVSGLAALSGGLFLIEARVKSAPADAVAVAETAKPSPVRTISVPAGTLVRVRLTRELDTARNRAGDAFSATLDSPVTVDGVVALPKNTVFHGRLTAAKASGRLRGRAVLAGELDSFELRGVKYGIATSIASRASSSHKKRNLIAIGGGSAAGATIGAIAGGGGGALIGAGAGAAAGTGGAALTGKKNVYLPVESVLSFRLKSPVAVKG